MNALAPSHSTAHLRFIDMRQTAENCAAKGGYTPAMFKADRRSMRSWARLWRELRNAPDWSEKIEQARDALVWARYFRDKSLEGSRPRRPVPHQLSLL